MSLRAILIASLFLSACQGAPVAVDACSWLKPIQTKGAVVRGSTGFNAVRQSLDEDSMEALERARTFIDSDRDILTTSTAGQIVAQKQAISEFCE